MKLQDQCVSLELARKLKELGVKQTSLFYWSFYDGGNTKENPGIIYKDEMNEGFMEDLISAFTVAELFELIGKKLIEVYPNAGKWMAKYYGYGFYDKNLANALAKLAVYLLENNLINSI